MQRTNDGATCSSREAQDTRQRCQDMSDELAWIAQLARLMEPLETRQH